jgi:hypothetical protein
MKQLKKFQPMQTLTVLIIKIAPLYLKDKKYKILIAHQNNL